MAHLKACDDACVATAGVNTVVVSTATRITLPWNAQQEVKCDRTVTVPPFFVDGFKRASLSAIRSVSGQSLSHEALRDFLDGIRSDAGATSPLSWQSFRKEDVVALVMPNGPELAVALLAFASRTTVAPLDPSFDQAEFAAALEQLGAVQVVTLRQNKMDDAALANACASTGCKLHHVVKSVQQDGLFSWNKMSDASIVAPEVKPMFTGGDDIVLLLRTSGTTSKPKVVPLTARGLYLGAVCIGCGMGLTDRDIAINVMPLTHIGGISCSLLSSLLTGGSVICAPAFDPALFLEYIDLLKPTWYYAAPTIHKAVAIYARALAQSPPHSLRLIRSGAANLADADAREMRGIFGCTVLPTYSMSECMPVAQPPVDYDLERPNSVGLPIAASLRIAGECGAVAPFGEDGEVCIKGPVVTPGYLHNDHANSECFFGSPDADGYRWFKTGDIGHIDADGFLFLTGRSKELIKRGGDQVSPYEVEEVLLAHPMVQVAVVFGVPNEFWGEEVASAVVLKSGGAMQESVSAEQLMDFASSTLPDSKVPRQIIFLANVDELPKTRTGKYIRVGLADRLGVTAMDLSAAENLRRAAMDSTPTPTRRTVVPSKSIYGVRYFVAIWVIFMHIGGFPTLISNFRNFSPSMPAFFVLAGFLLSSSTTRPVQNVWEVLSFYKSRIVAAHPLYILAVVFSLPLEFLLCPPWPDSPSAYAHVDFGGISFRYIKGNPVGPYSISLCMPNWTEKNIGEYWWSIASMLGQVLTAQLAFPWSSKWVFTEWPDGVLWFSSAYYFCLFLFPFAFLCERTLSSRFCWKPSGNGSRCWVIGYGAWVVIFWLITVTATHFLYIGVPEMIHPWITDPVPVFFVTYMFPLTWALQFCMGMVLYNLFEASTREQSAIWQHWGKLTDTLTLCIVLLPIVSVRLPEKVMNDISGYYTGEGSYRACTLLLCPWIYGLAIGKGWTAKFMSIEPLVRYLGPASYSMYLFHYPVAYYYLMVFYRLGDKDPSFFESFGSQVITATPLQLYLHWYDYIAVVFLTTIIALVCTHLINAPVTSAFMRCIDLIARPCCFSRQGGDGETTLLKIAAAIKGLSGAEVDADTLISDCGLDSFGSSALVGILRPRFPGIHINALHIYSLETVGDLVAYIDRQLVDETSCRGVDARRLIASTV
eukprot:TRINITY_DN5407_c0_g1_i4.p1 TRINITY_DN5407_c0_g1~~TRINITY_DN5407_c0_g1_i4.p1  ORF type:complete len:1170 (-),score=130.04 TRINITY_DN5407_c0_g1_i4:145-3618(-)